MKRIFSGLLALAFLGGAALVQAAPWKWEFSLKLDQERTVLLAPTAVHSDAALKRYYVVDAGNSRLVSYDQEGKFLSVFDAGGDMKLPYDMIRDAADNLWVVEKGTNTLTEIDIKGKKVNRHSLTDNGRKVFPDRFEEVGGVFYVLDRKEGAVLALDSSLAVSKRFACEECGIGFVDFKVVDGSLWALAQKEKAVFRFALDGTPKGRVDLEPDALDFPRSLAIDEAGRIFVLDRHRGDVAAFDSTGKLQYRFLEPGQAQGRLYYPLEIAFDPWGRLCVVDEGNGRVQVFSRSR